MTPEERDALKKGDIIYDIQGKERKVLGVPSGKALYPEWRISSWYSFVKEGPMGMTTGFALTGRGAAEMWVAQCEAKILALKAEVETWAANADKAQERLAAL